MSTNRTSIAVYVSEARHLTERGAKTLEQIGSEIGTSRKTVTRWLRRDHWALWLEHWASADEIWDSYRRERRHSISPNSNSDRDTGDVPEDTRAKIAEVLRSILGERAREVVDQFIEGRKLIVPKGNRQSSEEY